MNIEGEITPDQLDVLFSQAGVKIPKQKIFCIQYVENGGNASKASFCAGYDTQSHNQMGYTLLQKPHVKEAIRLIEEEVSKRLTVNPEYIIGKLKYNLERAEKEKNFTATFRGLELLAKIGGMFSDKLELTGKDGKAIELEQRTKEDVESFKSAIAGLALRGRTERVSEEPDT